MRVGLLWGKHCKPPLPILLSAPKSILRKADIEKFAIKKKKASNIPSLSLWVSSCSQVIQPFKAWRLRAGFSFAVSASSYN